MVPSNSLIDFTKAYSAITFDDIATLSMIVFLLPAFGLYLFNRKLHWKPVRWLTLCWAAVGLSFLALAIVVSFLYPVPPRQSDVRRIADIAAIAAALELYHDTEGKQYPPLNTSCQNIEALRPFLEKKYISVLPHDPYAKDGYQDYAVSVSQDHQQIILRALLKNRDASSLTRDADGMVLGCECNDPYYCVFQDMSTVQSSSSASDDQKIKEETSPLPQETPSQNEKVATTPVIT